VICGVITVIIILINVSILRKMTEMFTEAVILDDNAVLTGLVIPIEKKKIYAIRWMIVVRVELLKIIPDSQWFDEDAFFNLAPLDISVEVMKKPTKVRIYPKLG